MTKKEVRCPNYNSKGFICNTMLCEADIIGEIYAICQKCGKPFKFKDGIKK
jgi:hypothetical protein